MLASVSLHIEPSKCIGCEICELICSERATKKYGHSVSKIRVVRIGKEKRTAIPTNCDLCDGEPLCIAACPTDAIDLLSVVDVAEKRLKEED